MDIVITNIPLRDLYLSIAKRYNEAAPNSEEERIADAEAAGMRAAVKALGVDWGTTLMDADGAAMEQFGEAPMIGGFLLK